MTNVNDGETNGITADAPLVDVLRNMHGELYEATRKRWANEVTIGEYNAEVDSITSKYADMVERDYVRRDGYDFMADALKYMKAERDELQNKLDIANVKLVGKPDCEICDRTTLLEEIEGLTAECSKLTDKIGEITDEGSELMKKQPYTFDVHDVPGSLQTVGRYIDELTVERDELKAFSERLETAAHDKLGVTLFGVDYVTEDFMLHVRDTLMAERDEWKAKAEACNPCGWWNDSLQYCERNDDLPSENDVSANDVDANDGNAMQDSREKLEADVYDFMELVWGAGGRFAKGLTEYPPEHYAEKCMKLLDRQDAITAEESAEAWEDYSDSVQREIAELQEKVDALTQANGDLRDEWHRVCRERDELRRELTKSNRERERLRKSLGIAIDHAHDMIALVSLDGDTE